MPLPPPSIYLSIPLKPRSLRYQPSAKNRILLGCAKAENRFRSGGTSLADSSHIPAGVLRSPVEFLWLGRIFASTSCGFWLRVTNSTQEILDFDHYTLYFVHGRRTRRETMYNFVRSCVRFVFWGTIVSAVWLGMIAVSNSYDSDTPECKMLHYPCETPTTIYDPYGYGNQGGE